MLASCLAAARMVALVVSVPVLLTSTQARAEPSASTGARRHERFFMRLHLGPSLVFASTTSEDEGEELTVGGGGASFQIALGYNLIPNLVLYGEVFDDVTVSPSAKSGDDEEELEDVSFGMIGLGAGLAYYFPRNFFVSAAASLPTLRIEYRGDDGAETSHDTDPGLGVNLVLGREFWIADDWALGAAVHAFFGSVPAAQWDGSWTVGALGAGLSITYD
jgi:hypothetical protein